MHESTKQYSSSAPINLKSVSVACKSSTGKTRNLKKNPTLKDVQEYVYEMEIKRNFLDQSVLQKCLMLGEEVGELFKAIRKEENIKVDDKSNIGTIDEELADIIIFVCAIANRYNIDLEQAFRDKEDINKKRTWKNKNDGQDNKIK